MGPVARHVRVQHDLQVVGGCERERQPPAGLVGIVQVGAGVDVVELAAATLIVTGETCGQTLGPEWPRNGRIRGEIVVVAVTEVHFTGKLVVRHAGDEVDRARDRVLAVQGALGTAQELDALEVDSPELIVVGLPM